MRIAFLTPYIPYPLDTGGKIRSYYLIKEMARRHELDVFSFHYEDQPRGIEALQQHCAHLRLYKLSKPWSKGYRFKRMLSPLPRSVDHFHTAETIHMVQTQLQGGQYDLIFADELVMAAYVEGLRLPPRILAQQKIDHRHFWETATARAWGQAKILDYLEFLKLRRFQIRALRDRYALHVLCSTDDERLLRQMNPDLKTSIMPNGVDLKEFAPFPTNTANTAQDIPTVVYVGTMFYYPNVDAVLYFWREIYPSLIARVPQVRLIIVGHNPPPEIRCMAERPNVVVTGSVPDVRPYLAQSTTMIVPLRLGGGTRLKILEAMAMGVPVISTTVGCQGLTVQDGENILIADDPQAFAAQTVRLLTDASLRLHLSEQARKLAKQYDWSILVQRLLDAWQVIPSLDRA